MSPSSPEIEKFGAALFASNRAAFSRFLAAQGVSGVDKAGKAAARTHFDAQALLLDQGLALFCQRALAAAVGPPVNTITVTVWEHLRRTYGGTLRTFTWDAFATQHAEWSQMIAPKGEGEIYSPVVTENGVRRTVHARWVHALILDCDGTGTWEALVRVLMDLRFAVIFHESGGCTLSTPKWRAIIPLAEPFDTSTADKALMWRNAYATARIVFGALGQLRGPGLDPATDLVVNAWYPGYRRTDTAPPRNVIYAPGATLDLARLVALLPGPVVVPQGVPRRAGVASPTPGRTQPATGLASPSFLELMFEESGLLGPDLGAGRSAVICPWNDCHSEPLVAGVEPTTATVLFPPNSSANIGGFHCSHASCGSKAAEEVEEALPADAVHRARLRHVRGNGGASAWRGDGDLPRMPVRLPRLPGDLP